MVLSPAQKIEYEKNICDFIGNKGGRLDSNWRYLNCSTKIPIICEKGHKWNSLWSHIKRNHWCPECAGQVVHEENVRSYIESRGGRLDSNWRYKNKKTKFKIICKKGHIWFPRWDDLKNKKIWCPYCSGQKTDENTIKNYIRDRGGLIGDDWRYIDSITKFWITCKKGHKWETTWNII